MEVWDQDAAACLKGLWGSYCGAQEALSQDRLAIRGHLDHAEGLVEDLVGHLDLACQVLPTEVELGRCLER